VTDKPDTRYAYDISPVPSPDVEAIKFGFEVADIILLVSFFDHYAVLRDN